MKREAATPPDTTPRPGDLSAPNLPSGAEA